MIIRAKGTITIPRALRSVGNVIDWAREVNRAIQQLRDRCWDVPIQGGGGGGGSNSTCYFGEITTWTEGEGEEAETKTGIRGGMLYCGDKNYNVEPLELDLETAGVWLVSIQLECESNRDDDGEIFLSGIKTSSVTTIGETEWDLKVWTDPTDYDDNTNPDVTTGIGTIVIPLGKLTIAIADGETVGTATLARTGCGNIRVAQCGGILSHTRE